MGVGQDVDGQLIGFIVSQPELSDAKGPERVAFSWWGLETARVLPLVQVTLDCPYAFTVTAIVGDGSLEVPLIRYFEEIAALEEDWEGERVFQQHECLVLTCRGRYRGGFDLEISLDADMHDPRWSVQLRLFVPATEWNAMGDRLRAFFSEGGEAAIRKGAAERGNS